MSNELHWTPLQFSEHDAQLMQSWEEFARHIIETYRLTQEHIGDVSSSNLTRTLNYIQLENKTKNEHR